jgi:hypothetical protein
MVIWLVLWNHGMDYDFPLGISSSQLTFAYFFRGVGIPPTRKTHGNDETSWGYHQWWSVLNLKTCIFFHEGVESSNLRIWQTCRLVDPQKLGCQPRTGDSGAAIAIDIRMSLSIMNGMGNFSVSLSHGVFPTFSGAPWLIRAPTARWHNSFPQSSVGWLKTALAHLAIPSKHWGFTAIADPWVLRLCHEGYNWYN